MSLIPPGVLRDAILQNKVLTIPSLQYQSLGPYLTTAMASNRGSDFVQATAAFAGTNASGTINSTGISVSVAAGSVKFSAGILSSLRTDITFSNSNGVSFGLDAAGVVTATVATNYQSSGAYLTTAALSQDSSKYAGTNFATTTSAGTAIAGTLNTSGLTLGVPPFLTTAMQSNAATISNINVSADTTSTNASAFTFSNLNNVSFGLGTGASAGRITASIATTYAGTGITTTTTAGTAIVGTLNTSGLSLGVPAFLTTAALSQDSSKYAGTAFATTTSAGAVIAGTLNTSGLTLGVPAFLTTAMQSNAATISNINVSAGTTSTNASAFTFSNANNVSFGIGTGASAGNITASIATTYAGTGFTTATTAGTAIVGTLNTSGLSLGVPAYITTAAATASYWGNIPAAALLAGAVTQTFGSSIFVQPFFLPYAVSASYVRFLMSIADSGQGAAGTTQANTTFSCKIFTTVGLVLFSQGVGASSRSIQAISSTSVGSTGATTYSAGNTGSQYTIILQKTYPVSGFTTSNYTTSYASTSASINIISASNTLFTGQQFLDIPWASSIGPGCYWFGIGQSTSSNSNSANISFVGTATIACSLGAVTQNAGRWGALGVGSQASDNQIQIGQGVWTTNASKFTTDSIGVNSVSHVTSNDVLPFWFIRQA